MGSLRDIFNPFFKTISIAGNGPVLVCRSFICFFLGFFVSAMCSAQPQGLFDSEEIIRITLSGELSGLITDRPEDPEYFPVQLSYSEANGNKISIPLKIKQRGNFRRLKGNCSFPPLLLNFAKKKTVKSIFEGQDKIKLVTPCRGDEYVLQEYYAYKLYNLVSPRSFRVRLLEVHLDDPGLRAKDRRPFYGFLLEEEDQMATRNNMIAIKRMLLRPEIMQRDDFLNMAVFNYLIGNTDWSVQYRQNIKLIAEDSLTLPVTVPYDFDHAGIVRAPYAHPAEELRLNSTLQRRYRGFCLEDMEDFEAVIAKYDSLKDDIYAVYTSSTLLDEKYVQRTLKYLDDFYATIRDPKKLRSEFQYPCQKNSTGNIVIKGMKN
ncbi:hypothetical protein FHG64_01350 [Antarcticibacterium flavum]|uniref:Uncharacterized protein n=1 Tax=Antarcticibacterium flavum TaxID=2058175 RepID=A0A5B7X0G1_9FLAO|nr:MULTISPECIES: hypothetical protein [Antarcticibacterium]MCM4158894.1 hypothetical protein [Antarcticibacterium sp. W02-3]QCY68148.1 hypothetical protein FHG64_01350 [Antarcticibacterium flavum]